MTKSFFEQYEKYILFVVILFAIGIRLPYLNCPIQVDEGAYTYMAHFWLKGESLYKTRFFNVLPGLPFLYVIILKFFGESPVAIRVFISFYNALTLVFLYFAAKKLFGIKEAVITASIYAYLSWLPHIRGISGKELFMLLPCVVALYFFLCYDPKKQYHLFLCGVFSALAIFIRQSALPLVGHFALFSFLQTPKKPLKAVVIYLLGVGIPFVFILTYGYFTMGKERFLYQVFTYRIDTNSIFVGPVLYHIMRCLYSLSISGVLFLILAVIVANFYLPSALPQKTFLFSYFLFSFLGAIIGGNWFFHYYLQLIPIFSLWLGWGTVAIMEKTTLKIKAIYVGLLIIPFIFYLLAVAYTKDHCLGPEEGNAVNKKVVSYITHHTTPEETIYGLFYHNPSIYFLAKRKAGAPYLFRDELLFVPKRLEEIEKYIKDKKIDHLITYDLDYTLSIVRMHCEYDKNNTMNFVKRCFMPNFTPFCQDYPLQITLVRNIFKAIPQQYVKSKILAFPKFKVIIWNRRE